MWLGGRDRLAQEVDAAGHQILHRGSGSTIGHVGDIGAHEGIDDDAAEMGGGAGARRAKLHLRVVRLGVGDELLEIRRRQVLAHDQDQRHVRQQTDRREISRRVVERLLVHGLALGMGADSANHEGVAVRRRISDPPGAGHAARAADVLDHDLLPQDLAHARGDDAGKHIGRATGREWNDHRDGAGRVSLRRGQQRGCKERAEADRKSPDTHWWFLPGMARTVARVAGGVKAMLPRH